MSAKHLLLAIASAALMVTSALAQHHGGTGGSMGASSPSGGSYGASHASGGPHGTSGYPHGGARGSMGVPRGTSGYPHGTVNPTWHDFSHNAPPVRVNPHRYGSSVLPTPNRWRGNIGSFDRNRWSRGQWRHERHGGRYGWWWIVGPDWYFYDVPIYPYPDSYFPPDEDSGWWYWCEAYQEYYPYVTDCPSGWERVLPRD
jgi:hypothetical protein